MSNKQNIHSLPFKRQTNNQQQLQPSVCGGSAGPPPSKRVKKEHNYVEIVLEVVVCFNDDKKKKNDAVQAVVTCASALLNSGGGIVKLRQPNLRSKSVTEKDCDSWIQMLERKTDEFAECISYMIRPEDEVNYVFVRSASRLYTIDYGMKISKHRSIKDAEYRDVIRVLKREGCEEADGSESSSSSQNAEMSSPEDDEEDRKSLAEMENKYGNDDLSVQFIYGEKVCFPESSTTQFKQIQEAGSDSLLKGIQRHLPEYISAFANHEGGKVYFGIQDDRTVKGQSVENEERRSQVMEAVEKEMVRTANGVRIRIWGTPEFTPSFNNQWSVNFIKVQQPNGDLRFVIEVQIFPFIGGMFLKRPRCLKVDDTTGRIYDIDFNEWKEKILRPATEFEDLCEKFQRLKLQPPKCPVIHQLADNVGKIGKDIFPAKKQLTKVPEGFLNRFSDNDKKYLQTFMRKLGARHKCNKGFVISERSWGANVGIDVKEVPPHVVCDIFLMSRDLMPQLFTVSKMVTDDVVQYNLNVAKQLKLRLVNIGGCLEWFAVSPHVICMEDIDATFIPSPWCSKYPQEYRMTEKRLYRIRAALVIVLASFDSSSFNPAIGAKFLNILTPSQYSVINKGDPFMIIDAPPGTGKTVVAVERMKKLRRRGVPEKEILYLCENKPLCCYVREEVDTSV